MDLGRLAIDGGIPVLAEGPPPWPPANNLIHDALLACLADGGWGKYDSGRVAQLEAELARLHGVAHALTCSSGTIAVEIALRAVKVAAGDEVILAAYDFGGNFRAIEAIGARPVLVDIEPRTWCLDAGQLREAISPATKAVVVSHLHGGLADMQQIVSLCRERQVAVVEDACQTPGTMIQGRVAGAWGDVGVLSFGGSKLLTAGRGGAVVCNDSLIAQRVRLVCDRGNHAFPLSEMQAAVLLPQLRLLAEQNLARQQNAAILLEAVSAEPRLQPVVPLADRGVSGYYKVAWLYEPTLDWSRGRFLAAVQAEGVALYEGFRGFAGRSVNRCRRVGDLQHSTVAAARTVILHHPVLLKGKATVAKVALALQKVLRQEATAAAYLP